MAIFIQVSQNLWRRLKLVFLWAGCTSWDPPDSVKAPPFGQYRINCLVMVAHFRVTKLPDVVAWCRLIWWPLVHGHDTVTGWPQTWKSGILGDFSEHGILREWKSEGILCSLRENWLCTGCSLCHAVHMHLSVSDARKLLIWAIWDDRLLLVTWVVVNVEWPLIYEDHYYLHFLLR